MRCAVKIICPLFCFALCLRPAVSHDVRLAKLDLPLLSDSQRINLSFPIRLMATYEAIEEYCKYYQPRFESRALAAVAACVTPESITTLRKIYRSVKDDVAKGMAERGPAAYDCDSEAGKNNLKLMRSDLEGQLGKLDQMCRGCLIC